MGVDVGVAGPMYPKCPGFENGSNSVRSRRLGGSHEEQAEGVTDTGRRQGLLPPELA